MTAPVELYSVALVFALLGLLALWARRGGAPRRRLDVLETAALGQGRSVSVVRAGGKRMLVGVTAHSITPLAELDPAEWPGVEEPAAAPSPVMETQTP